MGATIRDIARKTGFSIATVSRVIHNNGFVSEETRSAIQKIIDAEKYPSGGAAKKKRPASGRMVSPRSYRFSMLWSGGVAALTGGTAQAMMLGLSEAVSKAGATLNIDAVQPNGELPPTLQKKTDGIFLNGRNWPAPFLERIRHLPVVWLLQAGARDFGDRVQPDHSHVGLLAFEYLYGKGCRELYCVSSAPYSVVPNYWQTRELAFRTAAEAAGVDCRLIRTEQGGSISSPMELQVKAAREIVEKIRKGKKRLPGLFVTNALGLPVYSELVRNGILPSRDLEMVAGDKEVCNGYLNPEPVRIDIHARELGEQAFELMLWRLQHPQMLPVTHLLKPSLMIPEAVPGDSESRAD